MHTESNRFAVSLIYHIYHKQIAFNASLTPFNPRLIAMSSLSLPFQGRLGAPKSFLGGQLTASGRRVDPRLKNNRFKDNKAANSLHVVAIILVALPSPVTVLTSVTLA